MVVEAASLDCVFAYNTGDYLALMRNVPTEKLIFTSIVKFELVML
jgi:hypothetical protein